MQVFHKQLLKIIIALFVLLAAAIYFSYQPGSGFYGPVFTHANTKEKVIALTFDDGPNTGATPEVLDILKKENIKATFFLVGDNVRAYPDLANRIVQEGHEVGNHTSHHSRDLPFYGYKTIRGDLLSTNQIIFSATGQSPIFFRPTFGFRTPWILEVSENTGLITATWNDQAHDYNYSNPSIIEQKILAGAKPGGIIVLHDGFETKHNVQLPGMVQALSKII